MGPHRTRTVAVNVRDLERFDAGSEVTPESLAERGLIRNTKYDLKILGHGDLSRQLSVSAHNFSKSAREKIEKAGGSITWLRAAPSARTVSMHSSRSTPAPGASSLILMTWISLNNCLVICSSGADSASTTMVMRENRALSVGATASDSML